MLSKSRNVSAGIIRSHWCGQLLQMSHSMVWVSLCWAQPWAVQNWLNLSRYRLECRLMFAQGTMHWMGTRIQMGRGNFGVDVPANCKVCRLCSATVQMLAHTADRSIYSCNEWWCSLLQNYFRHLLFSGLYFAWTAFLKCEYFCISFTLTLTGSKSWVPLYMLAYYYYYYYNHY